MSWRSFALFLLLIAVSLILVAIVLRSGPHRLAAEDAPRAALSSPATKDGASSLGEVSAARGFLVSEEVAPEVEERLGQVVASMWWHRPRFSESSGLALGDKEIEEMDQLCLEMLRRRHLLRRRLRAAKPLFREALQQLDLSAAAQRVEDLRQVAVELALIEENFVLDVLRRLSPQQLEVLRRDHPAILQQQWLKTLGGERRQRPAARPADGGASESERSQKAS